MILKATNLELERISSAISEITEEKLSFPTRVSYYIVKNKLLIEQALTPYRVTRDEIINKYSNGKGRVSENDNPELFQKLSIDLTEIAKEEVQVDISTILLEDLGLFDSISLKAMSALSFMIIE